MTAYLHAVTVAGFGGGIWSHTRQSAESLAVELLTAGYSVSISGVEYKYEYTLDGDCLQPVAKKGA
jgi:hypothetical protein